MPFSSIVMGLHTYKDNSHSKVKAEIRDKKHQTFTRLGGGITACAVIKYCTCALCF